MNPLPAEWSALRGRDDYLRENGFAVSVYEDAWTHASFFALDFVVPNTPCHKFALKLHDLHHVATGYGTDLAGEAEISAWELRGGLRGLDLYVSTIISLGALMGLFVAPRRTLAAWRAAKGARSLWTLGVPYEQLLGESIADVRTRVGAPACGLAAEPRRLHKNAPAHVVCAAG